MKILHINDYPPGSEKSGGAEVLMAQTVRLLRERDCEVRVFTSHDVEDRKLTALRYINHGPCRAALRNTLEQFQPDVVHLHNFYHVLSPAILEELRKYKRSHSARIVMTAHDYHLACPNSGAMWYSSNGSVQTADIRQLHSLAYSLTRKWDRRGWRHSSLKLAQHIWNYRIHNHRSVIDVVISPSRFMHEIMRTIGMHSVHLPYPSPTVHAHSALQRPHKLNFIFAGRVEPEKGLYEFLQCLPDTLPFDFTIVGEGSELSRCKQLCEQRGFSNRITFTGRLSHDQTMHMIAQSHVLALPSIWWENYPLSLLEGLALGTNIFVSNCGGMREIVGTAGVGFTFQPRDSESIRNELKLIEAAHHAGTLNSFKVASALSQWSEEVYLHNLMNVYRGLNQEARSARSEVLPEFSAR